MKRSLFQFVILAAALAGFANSLYTDWSLPHIISDNMMLQRDQPVCIWGQGDDGTQITVAFKDQKKAAGVKNGEWSVSLDPETHGGPSR
jgi:sialate O-acetylesterase